MQSLSNTLVFALLVSIMVMPLAAKTTDETILSQGRNAQVAYLAQAAGISYEAMQARLQNLGINIQTEHDLILAKVDGDAKRHAEIIAMVLTDALF